MLTGASVANTSVSFTMRNRLFNWQTPLGISPIGVQSRLTFPDKQGDLVVAQAASECGILMCVSSVSSVPLEKIAQVIHATNSNAPAPWFQLYNSSVAEISYSLLRRAKESGYGAIILTVDTCKYGYRTEELDAAYFPQSDLRMKWSQKLFDPVFNALLKSKFNCVAVEEFSENGKYAVDPLKANLLSLSVVGTGLGDVWEVKDKQTTRANDNLEWILDVVHKDLDMPLVVKGILHPDDARRAVMGGVDGIWVSNHGGRQVDGSTSTIEVLPGNMHLCLMYYFLYLQFVV